MRSFLVFLAVALVSVAAADAPAADPPKGDDWIEIRTTHFTLYGNAPEGRIRDVGSEFERFRAALERLFPGYTVDVPVPTRIFVFRDSKTFEPYIPDGQKNIAGFFRARPDGNDIVVRADWGSDPRRLVYHEFMHQFLNANFPPRPAWFDEGCAEYYGAFRAMRREIQVGLMIEDHIRRLRNEPILPLEKLFTMTANADELQDPPSKSRFYAESWALVHYLSQGAPNRNGQLEKYLAAIGRGEDGTSAAKDAFGSISELARELRRHVEGERFGYVTVPIAITAASEGAAASRLGRAALLAQLGNLVRLDSDSSRKFAEAHFEAALAEEPSNTRAIDGLAGVRRSQGRFDDALALAKKAVSGENPDSLSLFHYAELQLVSAGFDGTRPVASEPVRTAAIEEARRTLLQSLEKDPAFAEARGLLGRTYLVTTGSVDPGIQCLRVAWVALPARTDLAADLATLYERKGDNTTAAAIRKRAGLRGSK